MTMLKIRSKSFLAVPLLVLSIIVLQLSLSSSTTKATTKHVLAWTTSLLSYQQRLHRRSSSSSSRSTLPLFDSNDTNRYKDIIDDDNLHVETTKNDLVNSGYTRRTFLSSCASRSAIGIASAVVAITSTTRPAFASYIDPKQDTPSITKRVYLDVESTGNGSGKGIGSFKGRITIGLFGDVTPKLVDNFVSLCESNAYAGTTFYRVLSDMSIQAGAIGDRTGRSGKSAADFAATKDGDDATALFPDNYNIQHTMTGLVSMVNGAGGTVDSRFFINVNDNGGWGDDRYAVFGILEGDESFDIMRKIERVKVKPPSNKPIDEIMIVKSGVMS